jgi:type I restriction enzyme S subunit
MTLQIHWALPNRWEWIPLGRICDVKIGGTPSRNNPKYWDSGNTWVSIADLNGGEINESREEITDLGVQNSNVKLVEPNTVLISFKLTIGKLGIAGKKLYTNEAIAALPIRKEWEGRLLTQYLFHSLKVVPLTGEIDLAAKGKTLNKRKLERILVPIPFPNNVNKSLLIQRGVVTRIESFLAEVKEAATHIDAMNTATERLLETTLGQIFNKLNDTYDKYRLGDPEIAIIIPGQHIASTDYTTEPVGMPYLTGPADFGNKYPMISKWTKLPKVFCESGDILFTVKGSGVGKINMAPDQKASIGRQLMAIRPNNNIANEFLYYALLGRFFEFQKMRQGAAIPGIRKGHLEAIEIPLPSKIQQEKIITHLNSVSSEIEEMKKLLSQDAELLKKLEQSILMQAFLGEL